MPIALEAMSDSQFRALCEAVPLADLFDLRDGLLRARSGYTWDAKRDIVTAVLAKRTT